jgi:hypothetical protein
MRPSCAAARAGQLRRLQLRLGKQHGAVTALATPPQLTHLDLGLSDSGATIDLRSVCSSSPQLQHLRLGATEGVRRLKGVASLGRLGSSLRCLELLGAEVVPGDMGVEPLATAFAQLTQLQVPDAPRLDYCSRRAWQQLAAVAQQLQRRLFQVPGQELDDAPPIIRPCCRWSCTGACILRVAPLRSQRAAWRA